MNILVQIFIAAIVMILGFGLLLSGFMLLSIGRPEDQMLMLFMLVFGIVCGPGGLFFIIRLNRLFQVKELEAVLADPKRISLRFPSADGKKEIIIADNALFVGHSHYPFSGPFERLENLRQKDNCLLFDFVVRAGGKTIRRTREIEIPATLQVELNEVVKQLKIKYLS